MMIIVYLSNYNIIEHGCQEWARKNFRKGIKEKETEPAGSVSVGYQRVFSSFLRMV